MSALRRLSDSRADAILHRLGSDLDLVTDAAARALAAALSAPEPDGTLRIGLGADEIADLLEGLGLADLAAGLPPAADAEDEERALADLLDAHAADEPARRLARVMAARAMAQDHLWQDMGLIDRAGLRRLIGHAFPELARRNTGDMRWKRFFYRELCAADGYVACSTPNCRDCSEFHVCFGTEDGESLLARLSRGAGIAASF